MLESRIPDSRVRASPQLANSTCLRTPELKLYANGHEMPAICSSTSSSVSSLSQMGRIIYSQKKCGHEKTINLAEEQKPFQNCN